MQLSEIFCQILKTAFGKLFFRSSGKAYRELPVRSNVDFEGYFQRTTKQFLVKSREFPFCKVPDLIENRACHPQHGLANYPCSLCIDYKGPCPSFTIPNIKYDRQKAKSLFSLICIYGFLLGFLEYFPVYFLEQLFFKNPGKMLEKYLPNYFPLISRQTCVSMYFLTKWRKNNNE